MNCNRHEKGAGQETLGCLGGEPRAGLLLALAKCLAFAVGHLGQELRARVVSETHTVSDAVYGAQVRVRVPA